MTVAITPWADNRTSSATPVDLKLSLWAPREVSSFFGLVPARCSSRFRPISDRHFFLSNSSLPVPQRRPLASKSDFTNVHWSSSHRVRHGDTTLGLMYVHVSYFLLVIHPTLIQFMQMWAFFSQRRGSLSASCYPEELCGEFKLVAPRGPTPSSNPSLVSRQNCKSTSGTSLRSRLFSYDLPAYHTDMASRGDTRPRPMNGRKDVRPWTL